MWWMTNWITLAGNVALFFSRLSTEVDGWPWPFWLLAEWFWNLSMTFWTWRKRLGDFRDWAEDVWAKVQNIWTSEGLLGLIKWWFPWLYAVGEWFYDRWRWFTTEVGKWWDTTKTTVLGWIDIATEGLNSLRVWWDEFWKITWPQWMATLEVLGDKVSDFFTNTLPTLFDIKYAWEWWGGRLKEVQELIAANLKDWFPFYDDVAEFFSDPGEFLLSKFTDWFLGPEE